ncbi:MAG TPA: pilus assembly protein TadG-related protein, partial [Candidatus Obscuribacterales bacterium]
MFRVKREFAGGWLAARRPRGNMIVMITALTAGVVIALLFFALAYTRMLGGNQEQRTAIEAAALAAAKDLSRIVIEDPNFGWIGLS